MVTDTFTYEAVYDILVSERMLTAEVLAARSDVPVYTARRQLQKLVQLGWARCSKTGRHVIFTPVTDRSPTTKPRTPSPKQGRLKLPTVRVCGGRVKLTRARYEAILAAKPVACQCCGQVKPLRLDHDQARSQSLGP